MSGTHLTLRFLFFCRPQVPFSITNGEAVDIYQENEYMAAYIEGSGMLANHAWLYARTKNKKYGRMLQIKVRD